MAVATEVGGAAGLGAEAPFSHTCPWHAVNIADINSSVVMNLNICCSFGVVVHIVDDMEYFVKGGNGKIGIFCEFLRFFAVFQ